MKPSTKNDLPESVRNGVCEVLNVQVATAVDLIYQAKQAHWNVKGMQFRSLHKIFDEVAETAGKYADEFAERVAQLGGIAMGTVRVAAKESSLPEYPLDLIPAAEHLDTLGDRVALFGKMVRAAIGQSEKLGDLVTSDIFTDAAKDLDKLTWMIDAYLVDFGKEGRSRKVA
jgi:starvation-inducible DNA-binding protein